MRLYIIRRSICTNLRRPCQITPAPSIIKKATKDKSNDEIKDGFVDWVRVQVKAGDGGNGGNTLLSVYANEFAGPDGGNGGNGGHFLFKATKKVNSLGHLKTKLRAENGMKGGVRDRQGKSGENKIVDVPIGTIFRNLNREIVAELVKEDTMFLAARGGSGGKGNSFFKTTQNQTPMSAECGGTGEAFTFDIEMKTIADVGLVGFPNAGKSTLLRAVSRARPKVAAYPFTTLKPHIGMVPYEDGTQLSVADIPGIIEDAHKNRGLGISFLRHIERCRCLLYVLDMTDENPHEQLEALGHELEQYTSGLSKRPHGIIANKMDMKESKENFANLTKWMQAQSYYSNNLIPISAKDSSNIIQLLQFIKRMCHHPS